MDTPRDDDPPTGHGSDPDAGVDPIDELDEAAEIRLDGAFARIWRQNVDAFQARLMAAADGPHVGADDALMLREAADYCTAYAQLPPYTQSLLALAEGRLPPAAGKTGGTGKKK